MILVLSCGCLRPIHWSHVLSREWRCSWSSADRRCCNYIWVINNFIANQGATYIRGLTVIIASDMMIPLHGNAFRITYPFCGESYGHWWIPLTKGQQCWALMLFFMSAWTNPWTNSWTLGDLRCYGRNLQNISISTHWLLGNSSNILNN